MLTLLKAGIYTTIQDNGRSMGAHLGIPISGAMDSKSAEMVNLMVGNSISDALLECTFLGPKIQFQLPTIIAIAGAEIPTFLNDEKVDTSKIVQIKGEDVLSFGKIEKGCRFYIGIKGGIQSEAIFRSRSTCSSAGILKPLKNGIQLKYKAYSKNPTSSVNMKRRLGNIILDAYKGPEFSAITEAREKILFNTKYTVHPDSNRMAFRIKHPIDLTHTHSMLSSGTLPGTVQLTPSGELICLMRDTQTTGGYPRILQLTEEAICDLSQLTPNTEFLFQLAL